jgi:hypothetical protein
MSGNDAGYRGLAWRIIEEHIPAAVDLYVDEARC